MSRSIQLFSTSKCLKSSQTLFCWPQDKTQTKFSLRLINSQHLNQYQKRIANHISNTPRIVLVDEKQADFIKVYVEQASSGVQVIANQNTSPNIIRQLLKKTIKTLQLLLKQCGPFYLRKNMVRVTLDKRIVLWIHEDYSQVRPQFPYSNLNRSFIQSDTIFAILNIFEEAGCKKMLQKLKIKLQSIRNLTFEKFTLYSDQILREVHQKQKCKESIILPALFLSRRNSQISTQKRNNRYSYSSSKHHKKHPTQLCLSSRIFHPQMKISSTFISYAPSSSHNIHNIHNMPFLQLKEQQEIIFNDIPHNIQTTCKRSRQSEISKTTCYMSSIQSSGTINFERLQRLQQLCEKTRGANNFPNLIPEDYNEQITTPRTYEKNPAYLELQKQFMNVLMNKDDNFRRIPKTDVQDLEKQLNQILCFGD